MRYIAIVLFMLGILKIIIMNWSNIIKKSMTYKIYLDKERVSVGDNVRIFTEITNRKIIPIPWINIEIEMPVYFRFNNSKVQVFNQVKNLFKIITSLLCFEKLKRHDSFKCNKRGVYKIKTAKIEIGDFLGLVKTNLEIKVGNDLVVYPKIKDLVDLIQIPKSLQGNISVRRWIVNDLTQVIGVRKYTNGDSFNTIDWKSSAKNGELYVKKFDFTSDPSIMMFLDIQTESIDWIGKDYDLIENGIDIIASIMDRALRDKIAVGYTANTVFENERDDIFIYPSSSSNQKNKILDALAKTTYQKIYTITKLINNRINCLGKNTTIILLLSYISTELISNLNYYSKTGYSIKIILLGNSCNITGLNRNIEIIYSKEKGEMMYHVQ